MRGILTGSVLGVLVLVALTGVVLNEGTAGQLTEYHGWRIYYHNDGAIPDCSSCEQDLDMDIPEYVGFFNEFDEADRCATPLVVDDFSGWHGNMVCGYLRYAYKNPSLPISTMGTSPGHFDDVLCYIAEHYGRGTARTLHSVCRVLLRCGGGTCRRAADVWAFELS